MNKQRSIIKGGMSITLCLVFSLQTQAGPGMPSSPKHPPLSDFFFPIPKIKSRNLGTYTNPLMQIESQTSIPASKRRKIRTLEEKNIRMAKNHLRPPVLKYLELKKDYLSRKETLGQYLQNLDSLMNSKKWPANLQYFLICYEWENRLDFSSIKQDQTDIFDELSKMATPFEISFLQTGLYEDESDFKRIGLYFGVVLDLMQAYGLQEETYGAFKEYVQYVWLSKFIHMDTLSTDLDNVEKLILQSFTPTPLEQSILETARQIDEMKGLI